MFYERSEIESTGYDWDCILALYPEIALNLWSPMLTVTGYSNKTVTVDKFTKPSQTKLNTTKPNHNKLNKTKRNQIKL